MNVQHCDLGKKNVLLLAVISALLVGVTLLGLMTSGS